MQEGF